MEESGATPEPERAQDASSDDGAPGGGALIVIGIVLLVALVGLVAWMARGDDVLQTSRRADERFPTSTTPASEPPETSTTVPATEPAATQPPPPPTEPPTTKPATPAPTSPATTPPPTASSLPPGPSIDDLVPDVAAFAEPLTTPEAVRSQIGALLAAPRHDVASERGVSGLCATVALTGPVVVHGRWERDGRTVAEGGPARRDAPGFGDCIGNSGQPLVDGSYQYLAIDGDGRESAVGGFVVGAPRVEQRFTNATDDPLCAVRIAPSSSRYYEAYVLDRLAPGGEVAIPLAGVRQDVEVAGCGSGDVVASFSFLPAADRVQDLG